AAQCELRGQSWADGFNSHASNAARIYRLALQFDSRDAQGMLRERQAVALFMSGEFDEAWKLIKSIRKLRDKSPEYHFYMARMLAAGAQKFGGLQELMTAFNELDYANLDRTAGCPEFAQLGNEFDQFTKADLGAAPTRGAIKLTNNSKWPLRQLAIEVN